MTKKKTDEQAEIPFEEALKRLETLVEAMESGDIPLADLVARYEEGSRLLKICERELESAEVKIEKLRENAPEQSKPSTDAFDPEEPG